MDVWLVRTDQPAALLAELASSLDQEEHRRADALAEPLDRGRFTVAHGVTRRVLSRYLGAPAEELDWRRGEYGKPELGGTWTGVRFNLSMCGELAVLAVTGARSVGVDVERLPADAAAIRLARRFYPDAEAEFVAAGGGPGGPGGPGGSGGPDSPAARFARLWCRKEACAKAYGGRLVQGLGLTALGTGSIVMGNPAGPLRGPFLVQDLPVPGQFRAAVALKGVRPYRMHWRVWPGGAAVPPVPDGTARSPATQKVNE